MSRSTSVSLLAAAVALGGCKLARNEEQSSRDLPAPEPSAAYAPKSPTEHAAPAPRPRDPERTPRPPATPAAPVEKPKTPAPSEPAPAATPSATTTSAPPTAAATATTTAAAGAPPAVNTSCLPKCQSTLQACVSNPPALDGGLPSLESLAECRQAFESCRKECGL